MGMMKASAFRDGYRKLKIGMEKKDVIDMFGMPDSQKVRGNTETFGWWSREFKGLLRGGSIERKIFVEFTDGKVSGFDGENIDASIW